MQNKQENRSFWGFMNCHNILIPSIIPIKTLNPKQTEWVALQHWTSHVVLNARWWLAGFSRNNFPLIGRLMWLVVEWLTFERRISSIYNTDHASFAILLDWKLSGTVHAALDLSSTTCSCSLAHCGSLVLLAEAKVWRCNRNDSVIIFDTVFRPDRVPLIYRTTARILPRRYFGVYSLLASPNLAPQSVRLWTGSSVGFRSLELIMVCGFNRRNN